jgi:hypothetical protein
MKKYKRKAKYTIYRIKYQLPLKPSHIDDKHQFPPRKSENQEESRGLVKISANCLSVSRYLISISPFSTWSLRKWCPLYRP